MLHHIIIYEKKKLNKMQGFTKRLLANSHFLLEFLVLVFSETVTAENLIFAPHLILAISNPENLVTSYFRAFYVGHRN